MADGQIPADQLAKYGSSLTIEELDPASAGARPRKVILIGPALPFQGAEWGFTNQASVTWYAGNANGTIHNLGPREMPSAWEGVWRRTLMGKAPTIYFDEAGGQQLIVSPHILRDLLEDIGRAGVRLRVTWNVQGTMLYGSATKFPRDERYQIVREGLMTSFRTPFDRHTDIRWSIEFAWYGRGTRANKVASARNDPDLARIASDLEASVLATNALANSRIVSAKAAIRKSARRLTLGQLENLAGAPLRAVQTYTRKLQSIVSDFKRVGDIANKIRNTPFAIANAVVDFARNTTAVSNRFVDTLGRQSPEQLSNKRKVRDLLRAANYYNGVGGAASLNSRRGAELDAAVRQTLVSGGNRGAVSVRDSATTRAGALLAIHIAKTGDTPQRLSMRYYGNADQGATILRSNRLPMYTPTFRPGQILVIPVLTNASAQQTSTV